jgi:hypothetical protein
MSTGVFSFSSQFRIKFKVQSFSFLGLHNFWFFFDLHYASSSAHFSLITSTYLFGDTSSFIVGKNFTLWKGVYEPLITLLPDAVSLVNCIED